MEWWLIYLLTGAFVGFFAGLLGIGGGLIIVPVLISLFTAQDFPADRIIHFALGTTMATIMAICPSPSHMINGKRVASMNGRICRRVNGKGSMNFMPA